LSCFSFTSFEVSVSAAFETEEGGGNDGNTIDDEEEEDKDFDFIAGVRWDNVRLVKITGE